MRRLIEEAAGIRSLARREDQEGHDRYECETDDGTGEQSTFSVEQVGDAHDRQTR